jgi:transcriptional regulator with PAS, ATPase and Fis domain
MSTTNYNLREIERNIIQNCLYDHPTHKLREIAKLLGITERSLYRKKNEYNLITSVIVRMDMNRQRKISQDPQK